MWPKSPKPESRAAALVVALLALPGCIRLDMYNQPRYEPLEASRFYADGRSARQLPAGTVARGTLLEDRAYATGTVNDSTFATELPFALTPELLQRGRERYGIFCSVCHDGTGSGRGMVVRRGYKQPPSFHIERLQQQPAGYFFDVISRGFSTMPSYAASIPIADRWAIVAYLRALQLSQQVAVRNLPEPWRGEIEAAANQAAAGKKEPAGHEHR
ncbi:MAG TPA: cytochrome c [Candidatus Krumholzibacteria bacterium]|nr:cytochrome c [Candidatus Krumholzibacteria bacterium]